MLGADAAAHRDGRDDLVHAGPHHEFGFTRARFAAARQPERIGDRERQRADAVAPAPAGRDPVRGARGRTGRERRHEEASGAPSLVEPVGGEQQGSGAGAEVLDQEVDPALGSRRGGGRGGPGG